MAASPLMATADDRAREAALPQLQALDELVSAHGVLLGLGPLLSADRPEPHLPAWAAGLARTNARTLTSHGPAVISAPSDSAHRGRCSHF